MSCIASAEYNTICITRLNQNNGPAPVKDKWLYTVDFNYTSYPSDNTAENDQTVQRDITCKHTTCTEGFTATD